jgi:hypothetical protein
MASFEIDPGGYVVGVPLLLMGSLDLASGVYAYWMLRIAVEGAEGYWASWREDSTLSLATAVRRGGVSAQSLTAALAPYADARFRGLRGTVAFDAALEAVKRGRPVLVRFPPGSPVFPEGHHVVARGWCRVRAQRYQAEQLIINDPAIGERLLSREEMRACRSPGRLPFHVFAGHPVARPRGRPA